MPVRNWRNNLQRWRCKIETMLLRIVCGISAFCIILYSPFMAYASVDVATPFNADLSSDVDTLDSDFLVFDDSGVSAQAASTVNYYLRNYSYPTGDLASFGRIYTNSSGSQVIGQPASGTVIKTFGVYLSETGSINRMYVLSVPYNVAQALGTTLHIQFRSTDSSDWESVYDFPLSDRWRKYTNTSTGDHYVGDYYIPVYICTNGPVSYDCFRAYLGNGSKSMTYTASSDNASGYTFKIYKTVTGFQSFDGSYNFDGMRINGAGQNVLPAITCFRLPDTTGYVIDVESSFSPDTPYEFVFNSSQSISNIRVGNRKSQYYDTSFSSLGGGMYKVMVTFPERCSFQDILFSASFSGMSAKYYAFSFYLSSYKSLSDQDVTNNKIDDISNSVTNISNSITNISNKITNSTTTITNAISNVTTTITNAVNKAADTITGNADKNSQNVINSANQNSQKEIDSAKQNSQNEISAAKENADAIQKNLDDNTGKVNEKLEDVKKGIIAGIIDGLKSLFIPSDDFFKSYFDDLYQWFSDRLGFLMFPIDLILQLIDVFVSSSSVDCVLTLPSFSIMNEQLWQEQSFNLTSFLNEHFSMLVTAIRLVSSIGLIIAFVNYCERKWEEVMGN